MTDRSSIKKALLEIFSIVLAVLLALGVSEWQEDRRESELAAIALENVRMELESNRTTLEVIHENNTKTIDAAKLDDASTQDGEDQQFIPGIQVRSVAWNALLSAGISNHIDYDLVLALSNIYAIQGVYKQTGLSMVDASMTMSAMATVQQVEVDSQRFQEQFMGYFEMILRMEEALLEGYGDVLVLIEEKTEK